MDLTWFNPVGGAQTEEHWSDPESTTVGLALSQSGYSDEGWNEDLLLLNPRDGEVNFKLPA